MIGGNTQSGQDVPTKSQGPVSRIQDGDRTLPVVLRSSEKRRIMQQSQHLLRAIERTLVACVHEKPLVDDQIVSRALACSIQRDIDESETVAFVIAKLALAEAELEANDHEWLDALRFIYTAVRNQSDLETGEYSYLIYTSSMLSKET